MAEYIDRNKIFSVWRSMPDPASVDSLIAAIYQIPPADVAPGEGQSWKEMTRMRLIDANSLEERIKQEPTDGMYTHEIIDVIKEQPTVDAAEVVRCKNCKHRGMDDCPMHIKDTGTDDYCSYGERWNGNAFVQKL